MNETYRSVVDFPNYVQLKRNERFPGSRARTVGHTAVKTVTPQLPAEQNVHCKDAIDFKAGKWANLESSNRIVISCRVEWQRLGAN